MEKRLLRIDSVIQYILIATLAVVPLIFLPQTQDMFMPIKLSVLLGGSLLVLVLWAIRLAQTGQSYLSLSRASLGFLAITLASIVTLFVSSGNRIDALTDSMGPVTWISLSILFVFGTYAWDNRSKLILTWVMLLVGSVTATASILSHFQLLGAIAPGLVFLSLRSWSPLGTIMAIPWIALACLPLLLTQGKSAWKSRDGLLLFCIFLISAVLVASVSLYFVLPGGDRISLSFVEGWSIMAKSFSVPLRAVFGAGIDNYVGAFTQGRSVLLNTSPVWNIQFAQAGSILLHVATTMGILGLISLVMIARSFIQPSKGVGFILIAAPVAVLFFAPPGLSIIAFVSALYLVLIHDDKTISIHIPAHLSWLRSATLMLAVAIAGIGLYFAGRVMMAEMTFMRSLEARARNEGEPTYTLQIQALELNPWNPKIRIAYSQTNLDLANAIAGNAQAQRAPGSGVLSDADRQTITTLIQQAIREGKIAVNLNPANPISWAHLARLYHNIFSVAEGADQWAIASYQQAITLDPTNPVLRMSYSTLLDGLGDSDNALIQSRMAVSLKSDYALAYFSLAGIYRNRAQYLQEARALIAALQSVTPGSTDESTVRSQLEKATSLLTDEERAQIDQLRGTPSTGSTSQLTSPIPDTGADLDPKLELPEEASPPAQQPQLDN